MAETARVGQVSVEVPRRGERGQLAAVSLEALRNPGLTHIAQVSVEELSGSRHTRLAHLSVEVLWRSSPPPILPRFPAALAYGAMGGPGFSTDVVLMGDGQESRNINWAEALCRWDVGSLNRSQDEIDVLIQFFHAVGQGQEGLFLFRDFTDDTFDNAIGVGDGVQTTFHLVKRYAVGPYWRERRLRHPLEGTVAVAVDGTLGVGYALDHTTGVVQFTTPPGAGSIVSASGVFEVVCRFAQDVLPVSRVAPNAYSCGQIDILEVRQ